MTRKAEIESLMKAIAPVLKRYIGDQLEPLRKRLDALERRADAAEERGLEYRGIWQRAAAYRRGDVVTADGSLFVAIKAVGPGEQPGKSEDWQLCVKRGRDGKDAGR